MSLRPPLLYRVVAAVSRPILYGPFRLRVQGTEHVPATGGYVLACNHLSNFDPWPLGMPLYPERWLRFMAKAELYWWPATYVLDAAGAFPVHRERADVEAVETAVRLAREGNVVVMFPEGTRRRKGLVKRHQARARSGAARIALLAAVPLVPAAVAGTDRLLCARTAAGGVRCPDRDGRSRRIRGHASGGAAGDRAADGAYRRAGGVLLSVLLAVDGDSFAHRAYHALPKSIRLNAVVGFTNMLTRLWQAERPDAVLVAWDTLSVPTYRHEAFEPYQSGRVFEESIVEQLEILPEVVSAFGFLVAKAPGYEADDFLAASAHEWPGDVLVATSDRDAFQLASERVTILQPVRGVSELVRIGPAEVRERYGVEPEQVPDLIALRGDPSDKLPGARGIGPKKAAQLLAQYGSLEAALADGRFAAEAEDLRLFRRIATHGRLRPPSSPRRNIPGVGGGVFLPRSARAQRSRRPCERPIDVLTHPALARLHPTGGHPERPERLAVLLAHQHIWSEGRAATVEELLLVPYGRARRARPRRRGCGLARRRHDLHRHDVRGGSARGGHRDRGGAPRRLRARPPTRPPRPRRPSDGLLRLQQRRGRRAGGAGAPRARAGRDRRLRRPPRERDGGDLPRRRQRPLRLAPPVAVLPGLGRPGRPGGDNAQRPAARRLRRRGVPRGVRARSSNRRCADSSPSWCSSRPASMRTAPTRSRTCASARTASASSRAAAGGCPTGSRRSSKAATTSRRCPASSTPRSTASELANACAGAQRLERSTLTGG